jgi:penicillin amidase
VDAAHSTSGHPIVAGDPHQPLTSPSRFFPVHLRSVDGGGTLDVVGFSFVGTPAVELGHDERVAWTATTNFADVMDLWDVSTDAGRTVVRLGDGDHPIVQRDEAIFALDAGGTLVENDYVIEEVPGYGVLLPDAVLPLPRSLLADGDAILFQWTGFRPSLELSGYLAMDRAASVDELDAAVDLIDVGALNFVSADAQHIDYHVHALVPDRGPPNGRTMPWHVVPGDDPSLLWSGAWLDSTRLPSWRDPARGYLVTGNNDPWGFTSDGDVENDAFYYGAFYSTGARPYRVEQQIQALFAKGSVSPADMEALQDDTHSPYSDTVLAHLAAAVAAIGTDPKLASYAGRDDLRMLAAMLAAWDGTMARDRPEPVVYTALSWFASRRLFEKPLTTPLFTAIAAKSPPYLLGQLRNVLERRFPGAALLLADADEPSLLLAALDDAAAWLRTRFGGIDPGLYRWSDVNLSAFPTPLGAAVQAPTVPVDGASDTVRVCESGFFDGSAAPLQTMKASEASLYRMVTTFDDAGMAHATVDFVLGSEECVGDPFENDQTPAWADGRHMPLAFSMDEIAARTVESVTLAGKR